MRTDFRQFAALRRGADAHDPATLREVARQFESIFTKMMLDSMRKASFGDPPVRQRPGRHVPGHDGRPARGAAVAGQGPGPRPTCWSASCSAGSGRMPPRRPTGRRRDTDKCQPRTAAASSSRRCCRTPRRPRANSAWIRAPSSRRPRSKPAGALISPRTPAAPATTVSASRRARTGRAPASPSATTEYVEGIAAQRARRSFAPTGQSRKTWRIMSTCCATTRVTPRRWAPAAMCAPSPTALQRGGYATDPQYANKLVAIADRLPSGCRLPPM